jgi:hypothetical protein
MHACLSVDEILRSLAYKLVGSEANATVVALACCCKSFEDPALDALWETQDRLLPLLKIFPEDVWEEEDESFVSPLTASTFHALKNSIWKSFKRIPTKAEWTRFRKHARRIRKLEVDISKDPVTPGVLLALQLRTANEPLLPRLKTFECLKPDADFIPFIPLFLSPESFMIKIEFAAGSPIMIVAPTISRLSILYPDLRRIALISLPRDPVITEAVSEMLLGCNRDTLQYFQVESPLTEEAREVLYQLPKLNTLWAIIRGPTLLPQVTLPNLAVIDLEYDDHLDWLEGFRGAVLEKLDLALFRSESKQIGDFLGAFEDVALTTSASVTLATFKFLTSQSWNPNYRSLLRFTQLKQLVIEFRCGDVCASRVNDDIIISLAWAMPRLEILELGGEPCGTSTGVTIKGLIALACGCLHLSKLRIHFEATSLVQAAIEAGAPSPSDDGTAVRRGDCGLTDLTAGAIPIPEGSALTVAITLLQIFPRLLNIGYSEVKWEKVVETIQLFKRVGTFVQGTSKAHLPNLS